MVWIGIILAIIQAVPALIKIIQDIISLIHGHPLQAVHEHAFMGILSAWQTTQDHAKAEADLVGLRDRLKGPAP